GRGGLGRRVRRRLPPLAGRRPRHRPGPRRRRRHDGRLNMARPWFGLFLPQLRMSFDVILERTLAAEAAGFDSVWLMDHLAAPAAPEWDTLEGWTLAAGLATRTSTIRIGHLVTCDPFRHPALLAK